MSLLLALVLASLAQEPPAPAAPPSVLPGFRYEPGRIPVGRVYRYRKSNLDRSNPSEIALYLADETHLQSLKWHAGEPEATLVSAEMDWEVCSVRSFRNERIDADGGRELVAELTTTPDRRRLVARLGDQELGCAIECFPWHSYDFDLSSLNVALRFLVDPKAETEFGILDPDQSPGAPALVARGRVILAYEGEEEHLGQATRRYVLDGPGLEERGGNLWASSGPETFLVAFEIELPDEPGMRSGRLEWQRSEMRSAAEWELLVRSREERERKP